MSPKRKRKGKRRKGKWKRKGGGEKKDLQFYSKVLNLVIQAWYYLCSKWFSLFFWVGLGWYGTVTTVRLGELQLYGVHGVCVCAAASPAPRVGCGEG
jgi:hypothetical protein